MFRKNSVIKIASVIITIVIGAGFATGQELITFFMRYGRIGFAGIAVSGVIVSLAVWSVLSLCKRQNINNYNEFMLFVCGKKLSMLMETSVALFLFVLFSTMLSAGGEIFRGAFGTNFFAGAALIAAFCLLTFSAGIEGFVQINAVLAPIMVVGTIAIGLFTVIFNSTPAFFQEIMFTNVNWAFSAVLYASYNMLTAISVLCSLAKLITDKRASLVCGLVAGGVIIVLGICMSMPLFINLNDVLGYEIPMLKVVRSQGVFIEYTYLLVLLAAVFTTAVANGFAFIEWLKSNFNLEGWIIKVVVTALALVCAHAGFTNFVTLFYPLFGYIGIVELVLIFVRFVVSVRNEKV